MLQIEDGEINEYQLRILNQWSVNDVLTFTTLYKKKFSENPKEAKECLNTIYEYRLSYEESKELNSSNIHKKELINFFLIQKRIEQLKN